MTVGEASFAPVAERSCTKHLRRRRLQSKSIPLKMCAAAAFCGALSF